jgi:hypothetical protein
VLDGTARMFETGAERENKTSNAQVGELLISQ